MSLTLVDFFCGAGGSSQGAHAVPGVEVLAAANHWAKALESHALNFPDTRHYEGDIRDMNMADFPPGDLFWASPECPKWSKARGRKRDYDNTAQSALSEELEPVTDAEAERSRALMINVPDYLEAMKRRGRPVKAGVVENVTDCREWDRWDWWIGRIRELGYRTRVIALNSMHARPRVTPVAPQSRDRLYVAYWLESLGRDPDWAKWLRPVVHCPDCDEQVMAMQVFKDHRNDMGIYGIDQGQYVYRCPRTTCRNKVIEPRVLPAMVAIDWTLPGTSIGSRKRTAAKPEGLAPKTIARIRAGLEKYAMPLVSPAGGTWREDATSVLMPLPTRTTRESDGLAVPPLLVPVEGRADGNSARIVASPLRTQTARNQTGLAWLPFITELRGGSCDGRPVTERLAAITASGNHLFLTTSPDLPAMVMRNNSSKGDGAEMSTPVTEAFRTFTTAGHQSLVTWEHLLLPYYTNGNAQPVTDPIGTLTTRDRFALVRGAIDIADVLFRMLEPAEISAAMAFVAGYRVVGNKRQRVRMYGNAVTPPVAEVIMSALVECITGEDLECAA